MNSYTIFLKTFNHPDEHKIKQVKMFLKDKFPKWRKNRFYNQKFSFKKKITGQSKVLSTNKPVNILCFNGDLLVRNYFCYGQIALSGHKTE